MSDFLNVTGSEDFEKEIAAMIERKAIPGRLDFKEKVSFRCYIERLANLPD
jgi:hypothetical protein